MSAYGKYKGASYIKPRYEIQQFNGFMLLFRDLPGLVLDRDLVKVSVYYA